MKTLKKLKENKKEIDEAGPGLWANIRAKRQRIKSGSGERMKKPGEKGAPSPEALQKAKGTSEAATSAQQAAIAIAMKKAGKKPKDMKEDEDMMEAGIDPTLGPYGKDKDTRRIDTGPEEKYYFQVPFDLKTLAKDMGLRWDPNQKKWFTTSIMTKTRAERKFELWKESNMAEGMNGGTNVPATQQANNAKKRVQLAMKSVDLKLKQAKEREAISKQRASLKEVNVMFSEAMTKKKEKENAPSSKDKLKKGEALSGKQEPIDTKPELNTKR